jgi:hypothetical protein
VKKKLLITGALIILVAVYLQQRLNYAGLLNYLLPQVLEISQANTVFMVNKTIRLILNDLACLMLITADYRTFSRKDLSESCAVSFSY